MFALNCRLGNRKVTQKLLARYQSSTDTQGVQIPKRIERGPTDILRAIASTVGKDPTAAHYKYHDDPFFIPTSNSAKRTYALAHESGRKAALWFRQEHANLFQHRVAEPFIDAFMPRAIYDEKSEVSEKILLNAIQDGRLSDAVAIYNLLDKDGVSLESKQALLELLCFCNNEELISDDFTEERWFKRTTKHMKLRWKPNDLLEKLFDSLKNENDTIAAKAYNAMICGTSKYLQVERSWMLFRECQEKGLPLCTRSFNSVLGLIQYTKESEEQRKELLFETLRTMANLNIRPDIGTLNASLQVATLLRGPQPARDIALSLYKEITNIGVQPSLATYYYLLIIFCRRFGPKSAILIDILDKLEGKELEIKDSTDLAFFIKAMDIAKNHLMNIQVAHRIHKILLTGNNYNLIGENHMESVYYRYYLTLLIQSEPLDKFMAMYDVLVPNIYVPEFDVMEEILKAIEVVDSPTAANLLPRIWSQMVMFDYVRDTLIFRVLRIMDNNQSLYHESPTNEQYAKIAWDIWTHIMDPENQMKTRVEFKWTGEMLGDMAVLLIRGGYSDKMLSVLLHLLEREGTFPGVLSKGHLTTILDSCIQMGHTLAAVNVVGYAASNGFPEAGELGHRVAHSLSLNSAEKSKLINLVGEDVLQLNVD